MLRSHTRLADVDFPDTGIPIKEIRAFFNVWAREIQATSAAPASKGDPAADQNRRLSD